MFDWTIQDRTIRFFYCPLSQLVTVQGFLLVRGRGSLISILEISAIKLHSRVRSMCELTQNEPHVTGDNRSASSWVIKKRGYKDIDRLKIPWAMIIGLAWQSICPSCYVASLKSHNMRHHMSDICLDSGAARLPTTFTFGATRLPQFPRLLQTQPINTAIISWIGRLRHMDPPRPSVSLRIYALRPGFGVDGASVVPPPASEA